MWIKPCSGFLLAFLPCSSSMLFLEFSHSTHKFVTLRIAVFHSQPLNGWNLTFHDTEKEAAVGSEHSYTILKILFSVQTFMDRWIWIDESSLTFLDSSSAHAHLASLKFLERMRISIIYAPAHFNDLWACAHVEQMADIGAHKGDSSFRKLVENVSLISSGCRWCF